MQARRHSARRCRTGSTLPEVMIAVALLGLTVGGMCWLVVSAKNLNDQARDHYIAVNLAKNRMERARTFPFSSLEMFVANNVVVDHNGTPTWNGRYRLSTSVSTIQPNLKEMVVVVGIRNRYSYAFEGEQEELRSYFADIVELDQE